MTNNSLYFWMRFVTGDKNKAAFCSFLSNNVMNALDERAGSIQDRISEGMNLVINGFRDTMRPNDNIFFGAEFGNVLNNSCTTGLHILDDICVMNNRTKCGNGLVLFQCLIDKIDRTVDTETESGGFRNLDFDKNRLLSLCDFKKMKS